MSIENYFESDEFFDSLSPIAKYFETNNSKGSELIEYFINIAIKYSILFRKGEEFSTTGLSDFIKKVATKISSVDINHMISISSDFKLEKYVSNLYVDELLLKLDLNREQLNDENYKKSICTYIIRNLKGKDYKYHAFNSVFFDSILANGINPNANFTSQNEINTINNIFEKNGISMGLGWQKLNCDGEVSYSRTPAVSYYYGINSPEWFAQFTGQGFPFNPADKYKKDAYVQGDYDSAKNNLLTLMKKYNFASSNQQCVIDFFEKNWNIYANRDSVLAIIPDTVSPEMEEKLSEDWVNTLSNSPYYKNDIEKIMNFCLSDGAVDCQSTEKIDVSNAIFIKMPRYDEVLRRLTSKKTEAIQNESDKEQEELLHKKLMFLANAKIKVRIGTTGQDGWVSEHGEQELLKVKELLKDNDVYQAIVKNQFGDQLYLDGWLSAFDKKIINNPENIKLLAANKPFYFSHISEENRNNVELMRECACQKGISPILTHYVGKDVQNDFEFISNLIINSDENTFDFCGKSAESINGSNMRYGKSIGVNVQSNPIFWQLLNSKIKSINENTSRQILLFSPEKELNLVKMNAIILEDENLETNVKVTHRSIKN